MTFVVVSLAGRRSRSQRQNGLRAIESLHLALLVDAQNDSTVGRIQVEANDAAAPF